MRGGGRRGATRARRTKRSLDGGGSTGPAPQGCWRPGGVETLDEGWDEATQQPRGLGWGRGTGKKGGKGVTRARAGNGPRIDEDPVGPRHRVAGGPVGYKHGMRDGWGAQQPRGLGRGRGTGERDGGGKGATRARRTKRSPDERGSSGPRHRVAGDPVGYKHGMRGRRGRGGGGHVARAAQRPDG